MINWLLTKPSFSWIGTCSYHMALQYMALSSGTGGTIQRFSWSFTFLSDPNSYLLTAPFPVKLVFTFSGSLPMLNHLRDIPNRRNMLTHACLKILECGLIYQCGDKRKSVRCFQVFTSGFFCFVSFPSMLINCLPFIFLTFTHTSFSFFTQTLFFSLGSFWTTKFEPLRQHYRRKIS